MASKNKNYTVRIRRINGRWFGLHNSRGEFWDGVSKWTKDAKLRQLYPSEDVARTAFEIMQEKQFTNSPVKEFSVPLVVRVYDDKHNYTMQELAEYLTNAAKLEIDCSTGCGPSLSPCRTELELDFNNLRLRIETDE